MIDGSDDATGLLRRLTGGLQLRLNTRLTLKQTSSAFLLLVSCGWSSTSSEAIELPSWNKDPSEGYLLHVAEFFRDLNNEEIRKSCLSDDLAFVASDYDDYPTSFSEMYSVGMTRDQLSNALENNENFCALFCVAKKIDAAYEMSCTLKKEETREQMMVREVLQSQDVPTLLQHASEFNIQGRHDLAILFYRRALDLIESKSGRNDPAVAQVATDLAGVLIDEGHHNDEAQSLLERAIDIWRAAVTAIDRTQLGITQSNLAKIYKVRGRYVEAESLLRSALENWSSDTGPQRLSLMASALIGLADLHVAQGSDNETEALYKRALATLESTGEPIHATDAYALDKLAQFYETKGREREAESILARALALKEDYFGPTHPETVATRSHLTALKRYRQLDQSAEPEMELRLRPSDWGVVPEHGTAPGTATRAPSGGLGQLY